MTAPTTAKVFMSGRSQAVRIPAEFRFNTTEVFIRRDRQSGDLILSQAPGSWDEIFAALDNAGVPEDFLSNREQEMPQVRAELRCTCLTPTWSATSSKATLQPPALG
jgi:antitoxin VapB